ncbi:hypothetical protein K438DRAFT_1944223 [Mycena galopus ATCC 62051]|nr:hypothetical protein K438DRAFT_1944223 [Mycena galopus ATCC 62051]
MRTKIPNIESSKLEARALRLLGDSWYTFCTTEVNSNKLQKSRNFWFPGYGVWHGMKDMDVVALAASPSSLWNIATLLSSPRTGWDRSRRMGCFRNRERKVEGVSTNLRAPRMRSTSSREGQRLDGGERWRAVRAQRVCDEGNHRTGFPAKTSFTTTHLEAFTVLALRGGGSRLPWKGVHEDGLDGCWRALGDIVLARGNETELVATDADACGMMLKDEGKGLCLVGGRVQHDGCVLDRFRGGGARAYATALNNEIHADIYLQPLFRPSSIIGPHSRAPSRVGPSQRKRELGPGDDTVSFGDTTTGVAVGTDGKDEGRENVAACAARAWVPSLYIYFPRKMGRRHLGIIGCNLHPSNLLGEFRVDLTKSNVRPNPAGLGSRR